MYKTMRLRATSTKASLRNALFILSVTLSTSKVTRDSTFTTFAARGDSSASSTGGTMESAEKIVSVATSSVEVVFSDLDGTLIHYPENPDELVKKELSRSILQLPPSSTGMVGVISSQTLRLCRDVRRDGVKFVLVSGMRASTLFKRLSYLPRADAYCCEAGGRIFYPVTDGDQGCFRVQPQQYDGAQPGDLEPFYLTEDKDWRKAMERLDAAGRDGFVGNELDSNKDESRQPIPLSCREGALWSHARALMATGFVIDSKGYSTCFRVNREYQGDAADLDLLVNGEIGCPVVLSTSTNLGCVDFYPASSGKKNCCAYLAKKFLCSGQDDSLSNRCICLCDDDNDVEMALACLHAYIPQITSVTMEDTIRLHPTQFTCTSTGNDEDGTKATERALSLVLARIRADL